MYTFYYKHPAGWQTSCTTILTIGWMFVYTMQPVVQLVVSCKRSISFWLYDAEKSGLHLHFNLSGFSCAPEWLCYHSGFFHVYFLQGRQ